MTEANRNGPQIVVAYDGSAPARAAVRYAARRVAQGGKITIVHSFGLPSGWFGDAVTEPIEAERTERGRAVLDDLTMSEGGLLAGVDFDVTLAGGDPAKAVTRVAEAIEADEIVMGTRGTGRLTSLLGSVAQDVLHLADRPVVVIPFAATRDEAGRVSSLSG